jgi:hypothetical protein
MMFHDGTKNKKVSSTARDLQADYYNINKAGGIRIPDEMGTSVIKAT